MSARADRLEAPRTRDDEPPAEVLDTYAFDFGYEYYDDECASCPCCSPWDDEWADEVEKVCAEEEEPASFANRPRRRA